MSAVRVEAAYINGAGASSAPDAVARSEAFYAKLLQLHQEVLAGKNPRLTFAQQPSSFQARAAHSSTIPAAAVAHTQTDFSSSHLPGINHVPASQPFASSAIPSAGSKPSTSANSTPAKLNPALVHKNDPKRIKEARQKLERAVAEYAKADEPILKNAREIPLNLLALAHARVAPVSGLKRDSSEDSFDDDSYYSSKANSWSTEHTEPQPGQTDTAIVISDGDDEDLYEPPPQVDGPMSRAAQPKIPGIQHLETPNSNGEWEPDWDEDDDYEPPAPTAFGGSGYARPQQSSAAMAAAHHTMYEQLPPGLVNRLQPALQAGHGVQMPTIALNQIPTPAAPQPSRISPLTTGNLTHTMQSQISNIQQAQGSSGNYPNNKQPDRQANNQAVSAKELRKQKRQARKEAKAAAADSSKKRKRGGTPDRQHDSKGKRRAVEHQPGTPEPYIKPEPASPPSGLAAIPSRRSSVVYRNQAEPQLQSSPYRPRSAYVSDQEHSPRGYRYPDSDSADRYAMPPPKPIRRAERDSQDLRRVASSQHARRLMLPGQQPVSADPRAAPPRYEYAESQVAGAGHREASTQPSAGRPPRSPSPGHAASPFDPRYALPAPRPGQIVEDAYGNRYIAELVPEDYPPPSRRVHAEEYYAQYPPPRRVEAYEDEVYRMPPPTTARAYSHVPEPPAADRRYRAYTHAPQQVPDGRAAHRAYSVHPAAVAPQPREFGEGENAAVYDRRAAPSRYQEQTSPRVAAYTSEYPPIPRAYSVRPDATRRDVLPEYSSARSGSMAPAGFARRSEMAPPALPATRPRDPAVADDGYLYTAQSSMRPQYDDRRVVSHRY